MHRKKRIYRVLSIALAALMMGTATGYALDIHYCQGHVQSLGVFGTAKGCLGKGSAATTCAHRVHDVPNDHETIDRSRCCDNRLFYFQSDADQICVSSGTAAVDKYQDQICANILALRNPAAIIVLPPRSRYRSPPISRNLPVLLQSFLF